MAASRSFVCALVAAAVLAAADATFLEPVQNVVDGVIGGVVNATLNKGEIAPITPVTPGRDVFPRVSGQNFNITSKVFNASNIPFQPKTTYVQQALDFASVLPLYNEVAAYSLSQGVPLQNRGESHITVITPPEFANMQPFVTIDQLNALANTTIQNAQFCIVCLGRDTLLLPQNSANQTLNTVYNIVIHAPDIVAYRLKVQDLFIRSGGDGSHFDANHIFSPHITLGFTAASATKGLFAPTDLFLENDIFKFDQSCVAPITLF
ncbi:g11554 [Coccomyxa viridis]|uniref:G11554 protein n=1 Tax=Coccomyxa viridis TaxID=1274662 RepID=A0ABP1G887_9CHLO